MKSIKIRFPEISDMEIFIHTMQQSKSLHHPWVKAPTTKKDFIRYLQKYNQLTNISYLVMAGRDIAGVININEIIRGNFQNGYLGFYATTAYAGQGYMSAGLKLVLKAAFTKHKLHRLEANIQPENTQSIRLVENNGFKKEGFSRNYLKIFNEWRDHERWALTIEDWLILKQKGTL